MTPPMIYHISVMQCEINMKKETNESPTRKYFTPFGAIFSYLPTDENKTWHHCGIHIHSEFCMGCPNNHMTYITTV